jgi:hypothetical protein
MRLAPTFGMKPRHFFTRMYVAGVLSTAALAAVGCGRHDAPDGDDPAPASAEQAGQQAPEAGMPKHGQDLTITGCLTANIDGRSYALTPTDTPATPSSRSLQVPGRETLTYELIGNPDDLRRHVNTVVTARGRASATDPREAEMERQNESQQRPAAGTRDTPTVETKEEVDINVRRLHVASVTGSGEACPSIGERGPATGPSDQAGAKKGTPKSGTRPRPEDR